MCSNLCNYLLQMLLDRFKDFAKDTKTIGEERVARANDICDQLIDSGHSDAATIAQWKVRLFFKIYKILFIWF